MAASDIEKFRSDCSQRLEALDRTISQLKLKAARRSAGDPDYDQHIAELERHKKGIEERMRDLEHSDQDKWQQFKNDMEGFFSDMDKSMRNALRYYK